MKNSILEIEKSIKKVNSTNDLGSKKQFMSS